MNESAGCGCEEAKMAAKRGRKGERVGAGRDQPYKAAAFGGTGVLAVC